MVEKLRETMRLPFFLNGLRRELLVCLAVLIIFLLLLKIERASWKAIIFSLLYQSISLVLAQSHCVTYLFIDASREVDEGNKGDDSGDNEFPNEEQEVSHLVKNRHPYLGRQLSKVILKFSAGCSPYFWISSQKPALRTDRNWFLERRSKCRHSWNI